MERVIVAGADGSAEGRAAADWAVREAVERGMHVRVVPTAPSAPGEDADLIVLGRRADAVAALVAGSVRPVVLVPATAVDPAGAVTVGLDAREPADGALGFAFETARRRGVRLRAVHTWTLPSEAADRPWPPAEEDRATWEDQEVQRLSDTLRPWRARYPEVDVLADVDARTVAEALGHASGTSGLLVLGRRTGTTALAVLETARCPVAVVPS
ncbi:universal stress protein [Streptomyces sp. 7R007]